MSDPYLVKLWSRKLLEDAFRKVVVFGTSHPEIYLPPPFWTRVRLTVGRYCRRARDAWLVLIGRADIREDYE